MNIMVLSGLLIFFVVWFFVARRARKNGAGLFGRNMLGAVIGLVAMVATVLVMPFSGQPSGQSAASDTAEAADSVVYLLTKDEATGSTKRSVEVQIREPIDESTLERLANEIRERSTTKYDRTFIGWRIVGQPPSPYWATTHFNPDLQVQILGVQ